MWTVVIIYVVLVGFLGWLGWLIGSWLEVMLGKQTGRWIKYLIMAIVIPISMAICIIPTAFVFHYVFWEKLPESIWGIEDVDVQEKL